MLWSCLLTGISASAQSVQHDGSRKSRWVSRTAHQQVDAAPEITEASLFDMPAPPLEAPMVQEEPEILFFDDESTVSLTPPDDYIGPLPLPNDVAERAMEALTAEFIRPQCNLPTLGNERVPFALFEIDAARPQDAFTIKTTAVYDLERPDRSEYFWSEIGGRGPASPETGVDYQEMRLYSEKSLGRASGFMEIPLLFLNPDVNGNTSGLGNLQVGAKSILFEGQDLFGLPTPGNASDRFQVSTIMRTYISFSPALAKRGLMMGHTALEPGLLANYELSPRTFLHGETKYRIPLAGTKGFSGNVVKFGFGVSHVLDSSFLSACPYDSFALIPTFEVIGWKFNSGQQTLSDGTTSTTDSGTIINLQPGLRVAVSDHLELGATTSIGVTGNRYFDYLTRFEMRWFW